MINHEVLNKLRKLEKAELHVHLEGTVDLALLARLAEKNRVSLSAPTNFSPTLVIPPPSAKLLAAPFRGTFHEFISLYLKISECIRGAEDIELIAEAYARNAAEENITHAEVYVTPSTLARLGLHDDELGGGLLAAQDIATTRYGIELNWIFDVVRNGSTPGHETLECASRLRSAGVRVCAIGIAGLEAGYLASPFRDVFQQARKRGFSVYAHAGETAGPESVWDTLESLAPDRIGHGIRSMGDTSLVDYLREHRTPLEVCPYSNIALGVCGHKDHPVREMIELGLYVVLCSDDPGIFGKSLSENYLYAFEQGVSFETLKAVAERSLELAHSSESSSS